MRYHKVEETIPGFEVPEYLQKEAKDRLYKDFLKKHDQWFNFLHDNYGSELTQSAGVERTQSYVPLDFFTFQGWMDHKNWERLFYNETLHGEMSHEMQSFLDNAKLPFDLNTEKGKRELIADYERLHKYLPGCFAKEGEELNHQKIIAAAKKKNNTELTSEEEGILEQLQLNNIKDQKLLEEKEVKKSIKVGSVFPKLLQKILPGKRLMSN